MPLDLSSIAQVKNNVKRELLSDYVTLKFIGIDKSNKYAKGRMYLLETSTNFFYKSRKTLSGLNEQVLFYVSTNDIEYEAAKDCVAVELVRNDGTFDRFDFHPGVKKAPEPPFNEWEFRLRLNTQAIKDIT